MQSSTRVPENDLSPLQSGLGVGFLFLMAALIVAGWLSRNSKANAERMAKLEGQGRHNAPPTRRSGPSSTNSYRKRQDTPSRTDDVLNPFSPLSPIHLMNEATHHHTTTHHAPVESHSHSHCQPDTSSSGSDPSPPCGPSPTVD